MNHSKTLLVIDAIISFVEKKYYPSFKDIQNHIEGLEELDKGLSVSTFERYKKNLKKFDIHFVYIRKEKGYKIEREDKYKSNALDELINKNREVQLFDSVVDNNTKEQLISFQHEKYENEEYIPILLNAIKKKYFVTINYTSFRPEESDIRKVRPRLLKRYHGRWYIVFEDEKKDGEFGYRPFDRISIEVHNDEKLFKKSKHDPNKIFDGVIGLRNHNEERKEITLKYMEVQKYYAKTLPIYEDYEVLIDNEDEYRIKFKAVINHELKQQILKDGHRVQVIEPVELKEEILEELKKIRDLYI